MLIKYIAKGLPLQNKCMASDFTLANYFKHFKHFFWPEICLWEFSGNLQSLVYIMLGLLNTEQFSMTLLEKEDN